MIVAKRKCVYQCKGATSFKQRKLRLLTPVTKRFSEQRQIKLLRNLGELFKTGKDHFQVCNGNLTLLRV